MTKKVLVVEDNELNLKLFCDLLRAHEWAAEPVRDGREAVARARERRRAAVRRHTHCLIMTAPAYVLIGH